ncbi:uncharacterized protein LOC110437244 [Sorghum bicolor]|uniref:uncharacterized protein LOC110437244 n=1 Tax=Sorghum bicolor TaxID=4558 RepID=UPI000B42486D|nr:uncharacterized protein LOC110437244 [Sorghum bicolor]|eukprot:XP_021321298.1 uncharacterized protein LOC110437244 [Sorghum bicolor]
MYDDYFVHKRNAAGTLGLSCLQKVVAAFRMLAYGVAADAMDDYIRIGETTALESRRKFVRAVVKVFGHEYLRLPNEDDTARLLAIGESRGFPGMLGSIDCIHWTWKNCPYAWQGSHNDLNVLQRSPIFARLAEGQGPHTNYGQFICKQPGGPNYENLVFMASPNDQAVECQYAARVSVDIQRARAAQLGSHRHSAEAVHDEDDSAVRQGSDSEEAASPWGSASAGAVGSGSQQRQKRRLRWGSGAEVVHDEEEKGDSRAAHMDTTRWGIVESSGS